MSQSEETRSEDLYDAVIVGSGVSGAIIAKELGEQGLRVLVLEAGPGKELSLEEYDGYLRRFYSAAGKDNNSPYAANPNAPMPRSGDTRRLTPGEPNSAGYLVQNGPVALDSTYTRVVGGTTVHFEAKTLRMLPEDFELRSRFGIGKDWPIQYSALAPHYQKAEFELGVSADVEDQSYLGIEFDAGYVYPMRKMPLSYLDQTLAAKLDGMPVALGDQEYSLRIRSTPQGRNGIPNPAYDGGKGYTPVGAVSVHQTEEGERCQGNINCVPICPVQAKYSARKTLAKSLATGNVEVRAQSVASKVVIGENGRVSHIEYKVYEDPSSPEHTTRIARGRIYVLAANPVENARLMLASGLPGKNGLMGRNLMDHAYLLTWALMPQISGSYRGTQCTSGIEDLRGGSFRGNQAAFRIGVHNDGWGWATGAPYTDLLEIVDSQNQFGAALQDRLVDRLSRQVLLACMVEVLPDPSNRITVDGRYTDKLGNLRPVLNYGLSDYTMAGVAYARQLCRQLYQRIGAEDCTRYDPQDYGYVSYQGEGYVVRGGNHWAGTHMMGSDRADSVVDAQQRSWDHENLYLVGPGSMPSIGTANTTLTLAAMCFSTAAHMVEELKKQSTATNVSANA